MTSIGYRPAIPGDEVAISQCIERAGSTATLENTQGSWASYGRPEAILERINSGERARVAHDETKIVGFISFRRGNHLFLLFVDQAYQQLGIGRQLAQQTMAGLERVTVNSSSNAVKFYERLGFQIQGPPFEKRGALLTPMQWNLDPPDC